MGVGYWRFIVIGGGCILVCSFEGVVNMFFDVMDFFVDGFDGLFDG